MGEIPIPLLCITRTDCARPLSIGMLVQIHLTVPWRPHKGGGRGGVIKGMCVTTLLYVGGIVLSVLSVLSVIGAFFGCNYRVDAQRIGIQRASRAVSNQN